ncbi:Putative myotubularin-like phosphatase domain, protein-tyrosine phosphatase, active [Septoria linicola]|uniref:Myotubularin-like phosphatase domain, protein-tyrosine phosphatase, active n=1 Tax=Septoria linicola TaxID=215465 RepID=A0A9Q9EG48_9PEZI|nr:putative myotubularin-like phosphatase domain, protein-tyrosine phosphatase, active [Septoria linicola]USW48362.1 Putative myotubularin-like phosphatase domain, protein-tyrosine phosphatase, active [Septoria linicola]
MDNIQPRSKEIRVRNVKFVSSQEPLTGTLILRRHHLVFAWTQDESSQQTSRSATPRVSRDSSEKTATPALAESKPKKRARWFPLPLINQCVLRPSHRQVTRTQVLEGVSQYDNTDDDSAFPPVYGTSVETRASTDSRKQLYHASAYRAGSPMRDGSATKTTTSGGRDPELRIGMRDFKQMVLVFYGDSKNDSDTAAREVFYSLRNRCCVDQVQDLFAFHFKAPHEERAIQNTAYDARREFARMGIGGKALEGHGSAWRITNINQDHSFSPTYPRVICVPATVSDNMLKYGGPYRSKSRIPALTYLHSNGGSITRSSQPMPGLGGRRNPQDERLVSAIFTSHTSTGVGLTDSLHRDSLSSSQLSNGVVDASHDASRKDAGQSSVDASTALNENDEPEVVATPKIYGTTRRLFIVDARPKLNALANRATGGGIEDVSNYCGAAGDPPERIFLDIANIHVMRKSLAKVMESFGSAEGSALKPNSEMLQKSGWLGHIAGLLDGSEKVAKEIGLGGAHVLLHCSDGWDRTSQVAAIAQVMLDPNYRSIAGFIILIQKDFLSFGHKFNHRHGILGCEKWFDIENERVIPAHAKDNGVGDATFGSKALSGAKNWLEKNRSGLFRQQNDSRGTSEGSSSRPPSPPANPVLHAPATASTSKDREHKVKEDEIAPIFHQFLDAVFQLQHEYPDAFEFNARFLDRLLYQVYSCQYGEFLFNNERERSAQEHLFHSVWPFFMARRHEYVNTSYSPRLDDPLLFPRRSPKGQNIEVIWWSAAFSRRDEEMNTPMSLVLPVPDPGLNDPSISNENLPTYGLELPDHSVGVSSPNGHVRKTPSDTKDDLASGVSSLHMKSDVIEQQNASAARETARPALEQRETDTEVLAGYARSGQLETETLSETPVEQKTPKAHPVSSGLDFAAFAQGSAYSDR